MGPHGYSDAHWERCCGGGVACSDGAPRILRRMHAGRRAVVGRRHAVMGPDGVRGLQRGCGPQVVWGRRYLRENVKGEEGQPGLLKEGDKNPLGTEQHVLRF